MAGASAGHCLARDGGDTSLVGSRAGFLVGSFTLMLAARRTNTFTESVIREMTRIANQHEAVNLAQGFPDFPMPEPMKDAACAAIHGDINQYAVTWGSSALRI